MNVLSNLVDWPEGVCDHFYFNNLKAFEFTNYIFSNFKQTGLYFFFYLFFLQKCGLRIKEDHVIQHGLVVDGASLSLALREHEKLFMEVCKNCSAVLCCRMAPLQKAKVMTYCHVQNSHCGRTSTFV